MRSENQLEYQYVPEHELTEAQNLKHTDIIEYKSSLKIWATHQLTSYEDMDQSSQVLPTYLRFGAFKRNHYPIKEPTRFRILEVPKTDAEYIIRL